MSQSPETNSFQPVDQDATALRILDLYNEGRHTEAELLEEEWVAKQQAQEEI